MKIISHRFLFNTHLLAVLNLGFVSGLPLALTSSTLQAWYTDVGVSLKAIGALTLIGLPYTLKFLWAPIMDHYGLSHIGIGKRKAWMLITQFAVLLSLFFMSHMDPQRTPLLMALVALLVAFFSASQDVAITAYQTDLLTKNERGLGAAYYVFAYRIATLVSGGLAFILADYMGWLFTYQIICLLLGITMLITYFSPNPIEHKVHSNKFFTTVHQAFLNLITRERVLYLLSFVLLYKFGDALALSLMTNFLLHGLGFTLTEVGFAYKAVSIVAMIAGGFIGGVILSRYSLFKALLWFGLAQAFSNLTFVILALIGKNYLVMVFAVFIENFCSGLSTAAFLAFLMSCCDHRYTATQFALLSAIASFGRVFLGPVASLIVAHFGWVSFFWLSFLLSIPGLLCLFLLKEWVVDYVPVTAE